MKPMHAITTLLAAAGAAVALGTANSAVAAPAPSGTSACPASIRSVPGGARDASTRGFDDGASGPDQAYRPGQMLVRLDGGSTAAEFACVLKELGAVKLAGGRGRAGFAGSSDLMLVQLPPGRSVTATGRLLTAPRYRDLFESAQPNWLEENRDTCPADGVDTRPLPNDPYFPWQWGLDQGPVAASHPQDIASDATCASVGSLIGNLPDGTRAPMGDAFKTMRLVQAWSMTRRWWKKRSATVGIIDDSLVQHDDLAASVVPDASTMIAPTTITQQKLRIKQAAGTFRIKTGGGDETCDVPVASGSAGISMALQRRVQIMCGVPLDALPLPTMDILSVRAQLGGLRVQIGQDSVVIPATDLLAGDANRLTTVVSQGNASLAGAIARGDLEFKPLDSSDACDVVDSCAQWMIGRKGAIRLEDLEVDTNGLFMRGEGFSPIVRGTAVMERQDVRATTDAAGLIEVTPVAGASDQERWTFVPADAAEVVSVKATGYRPTGRETWPGQDPETPGAKHGQFIAGVIGAQANNRLGIAGALGHEVKPRLIAAVTPLDSAAALSAIRYLAGTLALPVVNFSRGTTLDYGTLTDEWRKPLVNPQGVDPRPTYTLTQRKMADYPGTLFVVAAGNASTNLNDLARRDASRIAGKNGMDFAPCGPKGMGVTTPPGRRQDRRRGQEKGGALSILRMPDGTFDRGNILCVAAMAPTTPSAPGDRGADTRADFLSQFSSWGAGIVDVAAPGEAVVGTGLNQGYRVDDGTSYAAPLVAAVAGLINARYPGIDPSLVKCAILSSATTAPLDEALIAQAAPRMLPYPYTGYEGHWTPSDSLTVPGLVVATEALSAAASLRNRTSGPLAGRRTDRGNGPTCVQRRDPDNPRRWINTPTRPVPQPGPEPPPAPPNPQP